MGSFRKRRQICTRAVNIALQQQNLLCSGNRHQAFRKPHSTMTVYLIIGITFGFAAAVQPGPMQTFLISRALSHGWRHTLPSACAPIVSDIPVVILVLLVLNYVPAWAENILHIAGSIGAGLRACLIIPGNHRGLPLQIRQSPVSFVEIASP
jgi:hypothetical protein